VGLQINEPIASRPRTGATQDECPSALVFVLKETEPENWLNDGGTDFKISLKPPSVEAIVNQVLLLLLKVLEAGWT